jgi:hypothetical protein
MSDEKPNYADGMFFYAPKDTQAHFLYGNMSINPKIFSEWLLQQPTNEKGFVSLQALKSKTTGKPYVVLNTYGQTPQRGSQQEKEIEYPDEEISAESIPF